MKYAEEISGALLRMAGMEKEMEAELTDGLAWVRAAAENPLDHNYFRVLYSVLEKIAEKEEMEKVAARKTIRYSDCSEGYKYGPDGQQLSNWDPDKDYGNEYVSVHFRIEIVGYGIPGFCFSEKDRKAFDEAIFCVFSALGWKCKEKAFSGRCATWVNGNEFLYLHPQDFSGVVKKNNVKRIAEVLDSAGNAFKLRWVDLYETVYDISDDKYRKHLESQEREIRNAIFNESATTRCSLFKFQTEVVLSVADKFRLKRVGKTGSYIVNNDPTAKYVFELIEKMIAEGFLVLAQIEDIDYIRSINKTEQKSLKLYPNFV